MADVAAPAPTPRTDQLRGGPGGLGGRLAGLSPAGRARVPAAWALYDLANTIFSVAVVSTAMALWFIKDRGLGEDGGQLAYTVCIVVSVGLNALVSPPLGALSDRGGRRLPYLFVFTAVTIVASALIGPSPVIVGAILFTVANFSYQAALIYYDATLSDVSYPASRGRLSGIGVAVGYMGTLLIATVLLVLDLPREQIFPVQALLFAVFAIPIFLIVREPKRETPAFRRADLVASFTQVRATIAHARGIPGLGRFLLGRFFYSDAVNTLIVSMAVLAVAMGLEEVYFLLLLILTVVAILASFAWGRLVDRFGPRRTLLWVLASWALGLFLGIVALGMPGTPLGVGLFVAAGAIAGSGLGGVQVADRVFMLRLSPRERVGEFFGLYGLVGKGSQVVGQILFGITIGLLFRQFGNGAYQFAILTLFVTMVIGYLLIRPVSDRPIAEFEATDAEAAAAPAAVEIAASDVAGAAPD